MELNVLVEMYAIRYRDYHLALDIFINDRDWEANHELSRAKDHLQVAIKRLNEAGINVELGALPETKEKLRA
jgi:hypothetical protein